MTKEEIDILWNKALRQSVEDGSLYTRYRFAELVDAAERNILAAWMIQFGFATGHGDTMEQLVDALGSEIVDRIEIEIDVAVAAEREACAKLVEPDEEHRRDAAWGYLGGKEGVELLDNCAAAIRARGETK